MAVKKTIMTAVSPITYKRSHYECMPCHHSEFYADRRIIKDVVTVTTGARNLISLAGGSWGYERSSSYLKRMTGIRVSKSTVRSISQETGRLVNNWQVKSPEACNDFIRAKGVTEMQTDGTMINTKKGWKEVRLTLFSKRLTAVASDYAMMDKRKLPAPSVIFCTGRLESAKRTVSRWYDMAKRLRIHNFEQLHVIADGASWIWKGAAQTFADHAGCLDLYHACKHLHHATARLFVSDGKKVITKYYEKWRTSLLKFGWLGLKKEFTKLKSELSSYKWKKYMKKVYNYFDNRLRFLDYPDRLRRGLAIGSGQIEGACKNMVGRRLKQTGARWKIVRANRMLGVTSLIYSN